MNQIVKFILLLPLAGMFFFVTWLGGHDWVFERSPANAAAFGVVLVLAFLVHMAVED